MPIAIGDILDGKYRILRHIGEGGMGNVYEGENVRIQRRVAIKELKANVTDADFSRRFEREAQIAARIGSEHIVEVLDMGELPDCLYLVMEYLDGESLSERMNREGVMAPRTLLPLIVQLLDGLSAAHDAGILHRDLKPANLFLLSDRRQRDFLKILDFGVSKVMGLSGDDTTNTGVMLGTPRYMSPEQAKGEKDIDVRTDIYSVGVIMYRGLTAKAPYEADTFNELLFKVVLEDPPSVSERVDDIEPEVAAFVAKAMARDKDERFASADEMATLLRAWLSAQGVDVPPPPPRRQSVHSGEPLSVSGRRPNNDGHLSGSTKLSAAMDRDEAPTRTVRRSRSRWYLGAAVVVIAGAAFAARGVIMGSVLDGGAATPTVTQEQAPATDDLDTAIGAPEPHADAAAPSAALEPSAAPDTSAAPETSAAAAPSALPIAPPVATVPHKTPHATPAPHPTPSPPGVRRKYRKEL